MTKLFLLAVLALAPRAFADDAPSVDVHAGGGFSDDDGPLLPECTQKIALALKARCEAEFRHYLPRHLRCAGVAAAAGEVKVLWDDASGELGLGFRFPFGNPAAIDDARSIGFAVRVTDVRACTFSFLETLPGDDG